MPIRFDCPVRCSLGSVSRSGALSKQSVGPQGWRRPWADRKAWRVFGRFALVYVTHGQGRYVDARGCDQAVKAGDFILVFPALAHVYGPQQPEDAWQEVYLVFEGRVFDHWLASGVLNEAQPIHHLEPVALWRRRVTQVIDPQPPMHETSALVEVARMQQLLADILAGTQSNQEASHDRRWLAEARLYLDDGLCAQAAARIMHCSYASFRKRFTAAMGMAPARYQAWRTIDRACEMMHQHHLTDKEIAAQLGFCDAFHFSKRFKQITGMSPRAYRQHLP